MTEPMTKSDQPSTDTGKWLLSHQGLVNIGRIDGSMRGDEIDLRAAVVTIEREARAALLDELEAAVAERIDTVGIERGRAHAEQLHDYEGGVEFSHNLFVGVLALIQQHREEGT